MEIKQSASLQEAFSAAEKAFYARKDVASSQTPSDAQIAEAFSYGYSEFGHEISERSVALYHDLVAMRTPLEFAEAKGNKAGLVDKIYMRRDALEHSATIAILKWAKRFSYDIPVELTYDALQDPKDPKKAVTQVLSDTLNQYADLRTEVRQIVDHAHADGVAEGTLAAGSLINHSKKIPVPDLNDQHTKELSKATRSNDFGKNTDAAITLILAGLAGDLVIHSGALKNQGKNEDQIKESIIPTVALGAGAAFYLGSSVHQEYADAQLAHIKTAGEQVDFTVTGDARVCSACLSAEDGNPYSPSEVPPIPLHGGCRCWYAAAGTI